MQYVTNGIFELETEFVHRLLEGLFICISTFSCYTLLDRERLR